MNHFVQLNRRSFFNLMAASSLATVGAPAGLHGANIRARSFSPEDFKHLLRGPIVSIPTPFTANFNVDESGLQRMIARALAKNITTFELTEGNSQFSSLSYEEIKQLTDSVVKDVGNRGIVIAGMGPWWTERALDFARYAERAGAGALQALLPPGGDEKGYVCHFKEIAANTRLPIVLQGHFPRNLLDQLVEIQSIVALKEDVSLSYFLETIIHFGNRLNCFSGGSLEWFLVGQPYGASAYFDTYSTFAPQISRSFWEAVQKRNIAEEVRIIEQYDHPLLNDHFSHSFWHASLEYFGVAKRYLRPPQHSFTDAEMSEVKAFYDKLGVYPPRGNG